jgi:hypothetical protein
MATQRCTNPVRQIAQTTTFCTVAPRSSKDLPPCSICFMSPFWRLRIIRYIPDICKICVSLWPNIWTVWDNSVLGCLGLQHFPLIWNNKTRCIPERSFKTRCYKHPAQHCPLLTPHTIILLSGGTNISGPTTAVAQKGTVCIAIEHFFVVREVDRIDALGKCMNGG